MEREIDLGTTLYDMNKQLVENVDQVLSKEALKKVLKKEVYPYFEKKHSQDNNKYFMLLCHEERDYTVFNLLSKDAVFNCNIIIAELTECLQNRGDIYSIEITPDKEALEIWLKLIEDKEMHCYYLFPYDNAVIEIGE